MQYELKKIDLWSAIKVSFFINALIGLTIGLLIGIFFGFIFGALSHLNNIDMPSFPLGPFGGLFLGIAYGVVMAVFNGIILTSITVILYNLFSTWLGGIKVDVSAVEPEIGQPIMTIASNSNQQKEGQA